MQEMTLKVEAGLRKVILRAHTRIYHRATWDSSSRKPVLATPRFSRKTPRIHEMGTSQIPTAFERSRAFDECGNGVKLFREHDRGSN